MSGRDRRTSVRYAPVKDDVRLGWWEETDFRSTAGRLMNVSNGGAALIADFPVVETDSFWLSLAESNPPNWIAARLVAVENSDAGGERVRLAFLESCPYDFFKAVVCGTHPVRGATWPVSSVAGDSVPTTVRTAAPALHSSKAAAIPGGEPSESSSEWSCVAMVRMDVASDDERLVAAVRRIQCEALASPAPWAMKMVLNLFVILLLSILALTQLASLQLSERLRIALGF